MKTVDSRQWTVDGSEKHPERSTVHRPRSTGFTLLEMLVAMVILAMAFTVIWRTFAATMNGWQRGNKFLENLHHGDFVIEQLVTALRSAAFYPTKPGVYGFWLESHGAGDEVSWVTSSSAFISPRSPLVNQLHRIQVSIDSGPDGEDGFLVKAWSPLSDPEEIEPEQWLITPKIKGLQCEVYDWDTKTWEGEWEDTNSVPSLVRITLTLDPIEKYGEPVKLSRLVQIPISAATNAAPVTEGGGGSQQPQPQPQPEPQQPPITDQPPAVPQHE